jgi:hypothetical protein
MLLSTGMEEDVGGPQIGRGFSDFRDEFNFKKAQGIVNP